ncbi:MAG TPA: patatin-like phospholipase family protein [Kofleriaceae bacterium]|nr:patatin-like phospholipase family protein [Kofleriaceae bacterium]
MSSRSSQAEYGIGLVLSGGGVRGAYEAGVLAGIADVLASRPSFDVICGSSVGAINAAHLAAHADRADFGIDKLLSSWRSLRLETHLRPRLSTFLGWGQDAQLRKAEQGSARASRWGRALLDPRPFEELVCTTIPWEGLHRNVHAGVLKALIVSALDIARARTNTFIELAPGASCVLLPARDPRRTGRIETITSDHVLASAALPLVFPARAIGGSYFCDGGLRFNTPLAPAIRTGARKIVVVTLRGGAASADEVVAHYYPKPIFLIGKVLEALLQDPIDYDLQVVERLNRVLDVMADAVPPEAAERIAKVLEADRGLAYQRVRLLVFRPSQNISVLALEHLRRHGAAKASFFAKLLLRKATSLGAYVEADVLSYILFDGMFASTLIELGRRDVQARAAEVTAFFRSETEKPGVPSVA